MKMKLLIGYDGSENSELIFKDLEWAGLPRTGEATVLSAADVYLPPKPNSSTPGHLIAIIERSRKHAQEALRTAQSLAEHGREEVHKVLSRWKIVSDACAETPAWAIVNKATAWKPDLIVVGAQGHSGGRFLGCVSQMVLIHSSQSVRIARHRQNPIVDKLRILIGFDGSAHAQAAIDAFLNRSWPAQTEVFLVAVIDSKMTNIISHLRPSVIQWFLEKGDDAEIVLGRMLESHAKKIRKAGMRVTCLVQKGDPKTVLVEQAKKLKADSLFVGARGLGNIKRFFIGGVSAAVAARANCSVEVVR